VKSFLAKYELTNKIITYVKDEGTNLNTFVVALTFVVSCATLQIAPPFIGTCFGHLMFKACHYPINDWDEGGKFDESLEFFTYGHHMDEEI
jgi:hypothetical protein